VNGGDDTVQVRRDNLWPVVWYTLGANVENGKVMGDGGMEITGNALNNKLWGGLGGDSLRGGFGNDQFYSNDGALNSGMVRFVFTLDRECSGPLLRRHR
jgi:serralysin